ncbi:MAG TPA: IS21 family transposase [Opitutaceae bacterium]|jgi:transposase
MITEHQYRRLMKHYKLTGVIDNAAMKAGMHRGTARRYLAAQAGPDVLKLPHTWRTRSDPLSGIWPEAERWLEESPEVEAKALFEYLLATYPDKVDGRALRTFQRRISEWLRRHGPPKEVFFAQVHEPGECIQTDWTNANELGVTIAGDAHPHLLCHSVLPYSNWEWAIPCLSESVLSLKGGLQSALWELRGVPRFSQTDQSSIATHQLKRGEGRRGFNAEYAALCKHLDMEPRTIAVASPNQNGDVEAAQGVIKRRIKNQLILRRSRDFASVPAYAVFLARVCRGANALREPKVAEERATLRPLPATRFPETHETTVRVSSYSTARVRACAYSVPARLIGAFVQAHLSEDTVRFVYRGDEIASYPRSIGKVPRIDYRHIIASLVRKPGAFARYIYREELFPRPVFRQAYDRLSAAEERRASERYLRLLQLASDFGEDRVADHLGALLRAGELPLADALEVQLRDPAPAAPMALTVFTPELGSYDALITEVAS